MIKKRKSLPAPDKENSISIEPERHRAGNFRVFFQK